MLAGWALCVLSFFFAEDDVAKRFLGQKPPEIDAKDWFNAPPKGNNLKDLEGRLVLIEFWATYNNASTLAIGTLGSWHKRYAPLGLVVIGLTDEGKQVVENSIKEQGIIYRVGGGSKTATTYGVANFPYAFLIAADGTVIWQGSPTREEEEVERLIQKYLRWVQYFTLDREVTQKATPVATMAEKGEFGRALREAAKLVEDPEPKVAGDAKYIIDKLLALAKRSTDLADSLVKEGKYFEALETLNLVVKRFNGHEVASAAEKKIKEWNSDPKIAATIEGDRMLDKADHFYNIRKLNSAKGAYEAFIKKFPNHTAAKDAQARLDEVNGWIASCFCGSGKPFSRCHGK